MDYVYMVQTFKGDLTGLVHPGWSFVVDGEHVATIAETRLLGSTTRVVLTLWNPEYRHLLFVNGWKTTSGPSLNSVSAFIEATAEEDDE